MKKLVRLAPALLTAVSCFGAACQRSNAADPPALPGTYWQLLSLTEKGEKITDAQNPADVEFLKDGKWGVLHYGGTREAGTYKVEGDRLVMKSEDGTVYQDAKMTWKADPKILELNSGKYLMRLRMTKPK
jgi:hypothetical protein